MRLPNLPNAEKDNVKTKSMTSLFINLHNGVRMPRLGYGVFQVSPHECAVHVANAIEVGYRSFDTAQIYQNEQGVGQAIADSGLPRSEFFITSKVWVSNFGYERAKASIDESIRKLGTDYIDLMLLHQPYGDVFGAYRALEDAYREGKLRAIGLSNFYADRYTDLAHFATIKPMVNQMETHVFCQQRALQKVMERYDTKLMSWGPFAEGQNDYFRQPILLEIGGKYGKTAAQVALRFLYERDIILIPKTVTRERMAQNASIFDFELSREDVAAIEALDTNQPLICDHRDPAFVERILGLQP